MKTIFTLLITSTLTGCMTTNPWKQVAPYPAQNGLNRFENHETVCYLFQTDDTATMQCRFKKNADQ